MVRNGFWLDECLDEVINETHESRLFVARYLSHFKKAYSNTYKSFQHDAPLPF